MNNSEAVGLHKLWRAVLNKLLADAANHAKGTPRRDEAYLSIIRNAYQDVTQAGPMLRYVCAMQHDNIDPAVVAEGFRRWCEAEGYAARGDSVAQCL